MSLVTIKHVYGEESEEYKKALKDCIESAERARGICDEWRTQIVTEKVKAGR